MKDFWEKLERGWNVQDRGGEGVKQALSGKDTWRRL